MTNNNPPRPAAALAEPEPSIERTDEFRFGKGGRSSVLQFRELINNYRVVGVDHEGEPFRMSIGIWNSLELATEDDFRRLAHLAEQRM